ncbi:MAG: hypothetical protein H0V89_13375 [Deltaproteobacteria bacterium]|nr:hypothetical protein [Deltaproteobacteria bacterium]
MRRIGWLAAGIAALACGGKLFTIGIDGTAVTVVQEGTIVEAFLGELGFEELATVEIADSEELANQGVEPGDIREVVLTDFVLTAKMPQGADLSFLDRVDVFVEGPGLPRVLIATSSSFPAGQAEVVFEVTEADITDYATAEFLTVTTEAEGRSPDQDTTIEAFYLIDVGVTAQGCRAGTD